MATNPQPFIPPRKGEEILDTHFRDIADGLNYANEVRSGQPSTYLRWAVTCQDFDNSYPLPSAFPNAYPFKWAYLKSQASSMTFPLSEPTVADDDFEHEYNNDGPSGYVFNRSPGVDTGVPFNGTSKKVLSYIAENSLILVGYGEGHYWIASNESSKAVVVTATCDASVAAATTGSAGTGGFLARSPVPFTARLLVSNPSTKQLTSTSVTFAAWNEWLSDISAFSLIKLTQESSGYWTVIGAECA